MDGSIEPYQNTTEGADISFRCNLMFVPSTRMTATCASNGMWTPDPASLTCTCENPLGCIHTTSLIPGPSPAFDIGENLKTGLCIDTPGVGSAKFY